MSKSNDYKVKDIEELANAINLTGGNEISESNRKIVADYANGIIDYETAVLMIKDKYINKGESYD